MIAELCPGKASNDFGTVGSIVLSYGYDYSNFGSQELQTQAQKTLQQFFGFVQHTFVSGLEIGRSFRQLLHELCLEQGLSQGEKLFDQWLDSSDFGGSTWMALSLIQVSEWFDSQRNRIQKLILKSVQSWSVSALKELTKISDEHLLVKLLKAGKQTVTSIRKARHNNIILGQPVTEADWELVADKFQADEDAVSGAMPEAIATLQAEAQRLAQVMNSAVLTDHLIEAIETLTEWDVSKLMPPHKSKTKPAIASFIANAGEPDEVIEDAQLNWIERGLGLDEVGSEQFRSCVHNLARQEAGEDGDITPRHRHVQQALQLQKLAPVVPQPQQSDRLIELEKQVRDLTAQLKEADKATALIHGLQAQRDRLERENQQLQALIQENAQKDLEIHLLQQQIEHLETTRSDEVLEELKQQNQQLLSQVEQMQQRYDALVSEMAAKEGSMKYADNSQLSAKVMALEIQLAEAHRSLEEQKPAPQPLTVGSYVRIVNHDNRKYCDRLGQVVKLPDESDTLNRFQVQLSGEKTRIICYSEQMEPVEVFLPPMDTFVSVEEAQEQIRSVTEEKQLQIDELQHWLTEATETIARYKDPQKNPQVLQWQQQVTQLNANLYDIKKQLTQVQQENQELKEKIGWELSPLGQMQRS